MSCGTPCKGVTRIVHGSIGLAKAALRIDSVSETVRAERLRACRTCAHSSKHPTRRSEDGLPRVRMCGQCRCWIGAKVRVAGEACPIGLWEAVEKL